MIGKIKAIGKKVHRKTTPWRVAHRVLLLLGHRWHQRRTHGTIKNSSFLKRAARVHRARHRRGTV
eukprot:1312785-Alexandrium_andersonii.AAC.1